MGSNRSYDVVIVGAGPAGSSAAFELANQGVRVALLEKAAMPRYKTCGGGVVYRVRKLLPFDVSEAVERQCHVAELNLNDSGLYFSVKRERALISMTMREKFDYLLFRAAKAAGAEAMEGCRVIDVARRNGKMEVITDRESLFSRYVIGADGVTGLVARKGGWLHKVPLAPLVEWEIPVEDEVLQTFAGSARFEFGPVPSGYAWIFPKKAHLSVGLGTLAPVRIDLKERLRQFLASFGIEGCRKIDRHGYFIPREVRQGGFMKGRIMLAGDAAGFVDPVTGEGITYAVSSGQSAARALIKGAFSEPDVREAYQSELKAGVLRELRWGRLLATLFYRSPRIRNLLFERHGQPLAEAMADILMGERTYAEVCRRYTGFRELFGLMKETIGISG